jgi:hypothetical protein
LATYSRYRADVDAPPKPPAYRAASLTTLAAWLANSDVDTDEHWRLVLEFLNEYKHEAPDDRSRLLAGAPPSTGDSRWDVLLAALAEHLAAADGEAAPAWCEVRQLDRFWFPFGSPVARADALVHAPSSFRRRGVFLAARELDVV